MWLISEEYGPRLTEVVKSGRLQSAEAVAFQERVTAEESAVDKPRGYRTDGAVATISIRGLLTKEPSFLAWLFGEGNTTYTDIIRAVQTAEGDPSVKSIQYEISSPGGEVAGILDAVAAIQSGKKPAVGIVDKALSGAYWLGAVIPGKLIARNEGSSVGSVGVVVEIWNDVDLISITSSNAPNKRPDVTTEEGKAVVREYLDTVEALFIDSIASGREKTVEYVRENFGRGGIMLATEGKKRGMVDQIAARVVKKPPAENTTKASADDLVEGASDEITGGNSAASNNKADGEIAGADNRGKKMDINQLKSQHPDLYAAVRQEGIDAGVKQERTRADAHITLGEASGEMKYALSCVRDGAEIDSKVNATHMAAAMKGREISAREADDKDVKAATGNVEVSTGDEGEDLGAATVAIMKARRSGEAA